MCEWQPRAPITKRVIVDLSLNAGQYNRTPNADDIRAVEAVGGRVLYQFRVALLRAELDTAAVRALVRSSSGIANAAFTVPDSSKFDARVQIFYKRPISDHDEEALRHLGAYDVARMLPPVVEATVPDSLIPRIAVLPGVDFVRATGWGCAQPMNETRARRTSSRCELPEPTVLRREGNAVLQVWELPAAAVWFGKTVPEAPGYVAYRAAIRAAGGDRVRPVADLPQPKDSAERELWRREDQNVALMYAGGGDVRPIRCLEAALFAAQDARYSELTRPTEFIAHILRRDDRLMVYFAASDVMFPPKNFYGREEVAAEVAAGWEYWVVLHNHTVRTLDGKPALGVPAPSTSDVQLFKGLVADLGLREVWVTNGMYTGIVHAENLGQFNTRE